MSLESIYQGLASGRRALKGGDFWQVGGEFLLENGECLWGHRMQTTRDHTEVKETRAILGLDGAKAVEKSTRPTEGRRWSSNLKRSLSFSWRNSSRNRDDSKEHMTEPAAKVEEEEPRDSGVDVTE
jgi:hypothetical protein